MWSFSRGLRIAAWSIVLSAPLALAACTGLTPIYGQGGLSAETVEVRFASPNSRLEQTIYNDLSLRFRKGGEDAPLVRVSASAAARALTNNIVTRPGDHNQMVVTATVTVTDSDGASLLSVTRTASADYTTSAQSLANQQTDETVSLQAAHLVADTLRLEILAALSK
ncbi:MAG: LPS assembly lipoprotein LptE [Devosia sp.]